MSESDVSDSAYRKYRSKEHFFSLSLSRFPIGGAISYKLISSVICFSLDYEENKNDIALFRSFHASSKHKHLNLIGFFFPKIVIDR
jgi:hypothetical protein